MSRREAGLDDIMILVIVGLPGSGKSTAAQLLREDGFEVIELGDIWRELLRKNHIPRNDPRATREFTKNLRLRYGKDIYAKYAYKRIGKSKRDIVIMGVRSTYEMEYFRKHMKDIIVIAITSPLKTRFDRLKSRAKPEDPKNLKDFIWLNTREKRGFLPDKKEEKHGVMVLIKSADYLVANTSTVGKLETDLEQAVENARKRYR
jgi:dephospho-CoA kinase